MKTFALITILLFFLSQSNYCQIKVLSNGNVGIGEDADNPATNLCIGSNGTTTKTAYIYSNNTSSAPMALLCDQIPYGDWSYGIIGRITSDYCNYDKKLTGIYGTTYRWSSSCNCRTYGVQALAGNGREGYNYAVRAHLKGDRYGAAIFATSTENGDDIYCTEKFAGYFVGDVYVTDTLHCDVLDDNGCDIRLKKDIRNLEPNNISKLMQLQTIRYKRKHPSELPGFIRPESDSAFMFLMSDIELPKYTADRFGFIAQEVQNVYPELISTDPDGYLSMHTIGLIPILTEAIKEQQTLIEDLQERVNILESASSNLKNDIISSTGDLNANMQPAILFQNDPNPFNLDTQIKFQIPDQTLQSTIYLYDLNGKQIKSYYIEDRGISSITIQGYELDPGIYLYTLIVDGMEIGTKRMILTE